MGEIDEDEDDNDSDASSAKLSGLSIGLSPGTSH